jgi:rhodanese-related sulfurtransferase
MSRCRALVAAPLPSSLLKTAAAVLLSVLLSAMTAAANEPTATKMVQPVASDETCPPEPVIVPKTSPSSVPALLLDHSCWVSYAEAEKRSPLWVDVRSLPETRAAPMPGALQIPLHHVSTKAFLKEAPVVLIGNGVDDAEMAMTCHQLKGAGFTQLHMLRYGARSWHRAGQPFLGNAETIMALDTIDAGHFLRGQIAGVWQVVGVNLPEEVSAQFSASASTMLDAKNINQAVDQIRAVIRERQQTRANTEASAYVPTVIIVTVDETTTQQLRQRWRELSGAQDTDMLWLIGGWRDYAAFVEQQQRMAAIAANPPSLQRPCGA